MTRLHKTAVALAVAGLTPALALRAQQPPTAQPQPPTQETAKDVVKAVEKADAAKAQERDPNDPVEKIKDEGLNRSKVMDTLSYLTDVIGPRLTGSPNLKRANEWTRDTLGKWGLENAHLEAWGPFGKGWSLKRFSAQVVEPQCIPLIAFPKAWSPGTDGPVVAEVVLVEVKTEDDIAKYQGKLKGAIVLNGAPVDVPAHFESLATRLTDTQLLELADAAEPTARRARGGAPNAQADGPQTKGRGGANGNAQPGPGPGRGGAMTPEMRARAELARKVSKMIADEGALAVIDASRQGDGGTLFVAQASIPGAQQIPTPGQPPARRVAVYDKDAPKIPVQITASKEHYNRLARMLKQGETLKIALDLAVQFHDDDLMAYNTVAEIAGTDLKDEVVMLGGHLDSWHSGTGATDNGAGVSVGMEAVRILKALDLKPRRTIRIGLWTGEEEGLLGSRAYVTQHFGKTPQGQGGGGQAPPSPNDNPAAKPADPAAQLAEFEKFAGYFNLDNGTGKVRGVYMQGNDAVRPIFRKWLQPFKEMGATTLTIANTGGTDHLSFDGVGLPGFQFIQDVVEYNSRTHHSNQDLFDRIQADDMKQASVVMAAFVYNTAMRDEKLPRKPATTPPARTAAGEPRPADATGGGR